MKATETDRQIEEIIRVYCGEVRPQRHRRVSLVGRKCQAGIQRTFLGYELKMGRRRLTCPDLDTARYLKVFAELGLSEARIPYDVTLTAAVLPRLERAYGKICERSDSPEKRRRLFARIRRELAECPQDVPSASA